jgi:hypothetical protein
VRIAIIIDSNFLSNYKNTYKYYDTTEKHLYSVMHVILLSIIDSLLKEMAFFKANIETKTKDNSNYRKVLYTSPSKQSQIVLMSLKPGVHVGEEKHDIDQFFRFESGNGFVKVDRRTRSVKDGDAVLVPAGDLNDHYF